MVTMERTGHAGICVVRFEAESGRWLVTVSTVYPLDEDNRSPGRERVRHYADPDQAIAAVTEFLTGVFGGGPPRTRPDR
jgi:hypothetical protein